MGWTWSRGKTEAESKTRRRGKEGERTTKNEGEKETKGEEKRDESTREIGEETEGPDFPMTRGSKVEGRTRGIRGLALTHVYVEIERLPGALQPEGVLGRWGKRP